MSNSLELVLFGGNLHELDEFQQTDYLIASPHYSCLCAPNLGSLTDLGRFIAEGEKYCLEKLRERDYDGLIHYSKQIVHLEVTRYIFLNYDCLALLFQGVPVRKKNRESRTNDSSTLHESDVIDIFTRKK